MSSLLRLLINPAKNASYQQQTVRLFSRQPLLQTLKETLSFTAKPKTSKLPYQQRQCTTRAYDVNTNVPKDVILYKYENPKFFKIINIFGICQFMFWTYLSHFAFTSLRDAPVEQKEGQELAWYEKINLGENKYRNGITVISFAIGKFTRTDFNLRSIRNIWEMTWYRSCWCNIWSPRTKFGVSP